ncbi:MAG: hypothetical protein V2A54_09425 [Bacteroidota bacterium]
MKFKTVTMKRFKFLLLFVFMASLPAMAQRDADLEGLRQITKRYSLIYHEEEFLKQLQEIEESSNRVSLMKTKYKDDLEANPADSMNVEIKNAENAMAGFKQTMKERYSTETVLKEIDFNLHMTKVYVKAAMQTKDDPDWTYSSWKKPEKNFMKAGTYLELLKLRSKPSDSVYLSNVNAYNARKHYIDSVTDVARSKYVKPIYKALPDAYTGADKEQLRGKAKDLFNNHCSGYTAVKVSLPEASWERVSGAEWDQASLSFRKYDNSFLKVNIVCRKKTEASPGQTYLADFDLIRDNINQKFKINCICSGLQYKPISNTK